MRICKNKITDTIAELFGANPLKVPESRIQPMCLVEIKDNKPNYLGEFKYLVTGNFEPAIEIKNSIVAEVSNVKSDKVGIDFGISILGNFLKAFKMDPAVANLAIKNSKKLSFSFSDVQRRYIEPLELGKILSENNICGNPDNMFVSGIMKNDKLKLALITDVLVSNNFSLSTFKEDNSEVKIDIPLIEGYISDAGLDLKVEGTAENEVKFKGSEALTFAFSCVEIKIDPANGKFSRGDWLKNIRAAKGVNDINESEVTEEEWRRYAKFQMDDNKANPLLVEL